MSPSRSPLWRDLDFIRFWGSQTVSSMGNAVSSVAVPLVAVLILDASPAQMGLLFAMFSLSNVVFGLFAGAFVDRLPRQQALVAGDVVAAALVGSLPIAASLHLLTMTQLILVYFAFGGLTSFYSSAYHAYLPSLVTKQHLVEANSKIEVSFSSTAILGPAAGGALIELLTAPVVIAVDALSFLASAALIACIGKQERPVLAVSRSLSLWHLIREGLHYVAVQPVLRSMTTIRVLLALCQGTIVPVYALYMVRELGFTPGTIGLITAVGATGSLLGSASAPLVRRRLGLGRTVVLAAWLIAASPFFMPLAQRGTFLAVPLMIAAAIVGGTGDFLLVVNLSSLRQGITPTELVGRVIASERVLMAALRFIGAVLGGLLGDSIGLRATITVGALGHPLLIACLRFSALRRIESQSDPTIG